MEATERDHLLRSLCPRHGEAQCLRRIRASLDHRSYQVGGDNHGYFLPSQDLKARDHRRFSFPGLGSEGPPNVGVAIFSFPDWEAYEKYRSEAENYEESRKATAIVKETKCFISYERSFMSPIF